MDIDIDLRPDFRLASVFKKAIPASVVESGELKKHLVGAYFQSMPKDPVTQLAAIPYDKAEDLGYKKIDFLSLSLLANFDSKEMVKEYARREPDWSNLKSKAFVEKLFHISKHYETVSKVRPTSILELADILALIRPGKMILLDKYLKNKQGTRPEIYRKRQASDLRKSHALAYATNIVINMNLLEDGVIK